jgi:hypothetical protein
MSFSSRQSSLQVSPAVSLEKGSHRIRKPSRAIAPLGLKRPTSNPFTTYMLLLLLLLASATLTCFGAAYYLFTTRWDTRVSNHVAHTRTDEENIQVVPFHINADLDTFRQDKFLAYLPHSGFHNQRIAFENGLVLSRLLNRTLLVPPVRYGERPLRYVRFEALQQHTHLSGKEGLGHCALVPLLAALPFECQDYFDYTHVPWEWLVNLTTIKSHQRLLQRWNMSNAWLLEHLELSEDDILTLPDTDPYHFRFLDTSETSTDKYLESVYIRELALSPKRLLQIGTLFGSSRLRLRNAHNLRIRGDTRRSMAFSNVYLTPIADSIANALGRTYLGAHVRLGDGHFISNAHANARLVWWKLVHVVLKLSVEETLTLERQLAHPDEAEFRPIPIPTDHSAWQISHSSVALLPELSLPCRSPLHSLPHLKPLNVPLFISTDAQDPLTHPSIVRFLQTFPCTFLLSDMLSYTAPLRRLQSGHDGVMLGDFLMASLDAMIVGKAWAVVGTEQSTFSRFVEDVLWRVYHGLKIIERG